MRISFNSRTAKIGISVAALFGLVLIAFNTNLLNEKYCPQCHTEQHVVDGNVEYQRRISERQAERMKFFAEHPKVKVCGTGSHFADDADRDLLVDSWYCEKCEGVTPKQDPHIRDFQNDIARIGRLFQPE